MSTNFEQAGKIASAANSVAADRSVPDGSIVLQASKVATRYANGALGLRDGSITVARGQIVAIIGPNGAGKTTLLRSMTGFMRSERARICSGRVLLNGEDVTSREPHHTAQAGLILVPDRNKVFRSLTVDENLKALGSVGTKAQLRERRDRVLELFPALTEKLNGLAGWLSGGQQQMLAIGRGLMCAPRVLMLDEMTLGLHPSLRGPLFELLPKISEDGTAVVVVDESIELAVQYAAYSYVLSQGRVVGQGGPDELTPERIGRLYLGNADKQALPEVKS